MAGEDGSPDDPDAAVIAGEVYAWTGAPFGMYKYRGRLEIRVCHNSLFLPICLPKLGLHVYTCQDDS